MTTSREGQHASAGQTTTSLCVFQVCGEAYGVESRHIVRVLGETPLHRVPRAPRSLAGALSHRGDVLPVVCPRRVLGLDDTELLRSVVVISPEGEGELFGLAVDAVQGVVDAPAAAYEANPSTLDASHATLFAGSYRVTEGYVISLNVASFAPAVAEIRSSFNSGGDACVLS